MRIGIVSDTHGLLRPEVIVALAGLHIYMTHKKKDLPSDLGNYDLVVVGHTHKYEEVRIGKTLLINPGSCGPRRFHQAITMATADITDGSIQITRIDIPQKSSGALSKTGAADLKKQIEIVMRETQKSKSPEEIAYKYGFDTAMTEQIARLHLIHPNVDADGIMTRMGY